MPYKLILLLVVLLIVSGCNNEGRQQNYKIIYKGEGKQLIESDENSNQKFTIAVIPKVSGIPYFNMVEEGMKEAAKDLNVDVIFSGPLIADWKEQKRLVEKFIENDVDAIAISANDPEKLGSVLNSAKKQGIKIITWDSDTNKQYRQYFVNSVDPELLGRHVMDTLSANLNEEGKYAIITGSENAATVKEWTKWMLAQQQEKYPKMELIDVVESDDDPKKAYLLAKDMIKKHSDIKGIIGSTSVGPPSAAQAVMDANKKGEIQVVGLSSPNLLRQYIVNETIKIGTLWSPKKLGYLTVSITKEALLGNKIVDNMSIPNVGVIRLNGDSVIMGQPIDFTKENINQYDF